MKNIVHKEYPEFRELIKEIADKVCDEINLKTPKIKSKMPYKAQYTLEEVIKVLESRV